MSFVYLRTSDTLMQLLTSLAVAGRQKPQQLLKALEEMPRSCSEEAVPLTNVVMSLYVAFANKQREAMMDAVVL
eukprot:scaffold304337_cov28-Prasinocladus_malaysianus.AAC.1